MLNEKLTYVSNHISLYKNSRDILKMNITK